MRRRSGRRIGVSPRAPSIRTSPPSGSISRLMIFSMVVLPEPEPPTSATNDAGFDRQRHMRDRKSAAAVKGLADLVDLDQRRRSHVRR